jgi:hypothetical protein
MKQESGSGQKWFTAFILSPGMIFTSAYLLVWLSINHYLDHTFKHHLKQIFVTEANRQYRIDIGSLRSGADLNSLMFKKLELTPVGETQNKKKNLSVMEITELRIECPDLSFFPFRPADEIHSIRMVSRKILSNSVQ